MAQMKPTISRGDRGGHDHLGLARRCQAPVALTQAQLCPPGDVADGWRQAFDPVEQLAADPGLHSVGPGALDQDPTGSGTAAIGSGHAFGRARDLAAWLGLVPKQITTGGRPRLLGIIKRGNVYLRKLRMPGTLARRRLSLLA
jgi:hypothetical protein